LPSKNGTQEGRRMKDEGREKTGSLFFLLPSSFFFLLLFHPSSFILHPFLSRVSAMPDGVPPASPESLMVCPECGASVPPRSFALHMRQRHRIYEHTGRRGTREE